MPYLVWILNKVGAPPSGSRIELLLPQVLEKQSGFQRTLPHINPNFAKILLQDCCQLCPRYIARGQQEFKTESHAIFISDPIAIRILPASFIQQFFSMFRIV